MVEFVKRLCFGILRGFLDAVYSLMDEKCNASVINASVIGSIVQANIVQENIKKIHNAGVLCSLYQLC